MSKLGDAVSWNRKKKEEYGLGSLGGTKPKSHFSSQEIGSSLRGTSVTPVPSYTGTEGDQSERDLKALSGGTGPTPTLPHEKQFDPQPKYKADAPVGTVSTYAAANQGAFQLPAAEYGAGSQIKQHPKPERRFQKNVGTAVPGGPPSSSASTYAASNQGTSQPPSLPYAAGLQEERHMSRASRAMPEAEDWKRKKWQEGKPEKDGVYDRMYRRQEPGEATGQGAFHRYEKLPSPEERLKAYVALMDQPDFWEKSVYQNTYNKDREKFSAIAGIYTDTGFDDILYDYINGNDIAKNRISLAPGVRTYAPVPEEAVRLFNYLYRTQGPEEAYAFMDLISQKQYTGIEAAAFGAVDAMGVTSLSSAFGKGVSTLLGENWEAAELDPLREDRQLARAQHPTAYRVGGMGGSLSLMIGLGAGAHKLTGALSAGIRIGGRMVQVVLPKVVEGAVNSSLTFLSKEAIQNAGAAATGEMSGTDYLKSMGKAGAQGMAGGLAGGLVNSGLETVLRESGMMTGFMEFIKQTTAGFAGATANVGTGYVLSEEKPSGEQIAMDLTTAFLFSVIQGGIAASQTTNATKTYMEKQYEHIVSDYSAMSREWNTLPPEEQMEYAKAIQGYTQELRAGLGVEYLAGQQRFVNDMTRALDTLDRAMEAYVSQASSGGTAQGGALTPALGSQGGDLALQIQKSMEEGLAAAAAPPAVRGGSGVWGAIGVPQTSAGEAGAKLVDDATADKLLLERTMVDFLTRKGGLKLTKDMSPEQRRTAIRQAVERMVRKGKVTSDSTGSLDTEKNEGYDEVGKAISGDLDGEDKKLTDSGQTAKLSEQEMTEEELGVLLKYKSSESYTLNAALRDGKPLDQSQQKMMETMDQALKKAPVYQGTVYRHMSFDMVEEEVFEAFLGNHQPGAFVQYPAFTSASLVTDGYTIDGKLTVTLIIKSKSGRNMDGYGNNFEREILFARLSAFYVERVETDDQGRPVIYMEEVAENGIQ